MKKIISSSLKIIVIMFVVIHGAAYKGQGQAPCGFDLLYNQILLDPLSQNPYNQFEGNIYNLIQSNFQNLVSQPNNFAIPVVVHLVGNEANSLTNTDVINQIDELNLAFSNGYGSILSSADNAQIKFCLAQISPIQIGVRIM